MVKLENLSDGGGKLTFCYVGFLGFECSEESFYRGEAESISYPLCIVDED